MKILKIGQSLDQVEERDPVPGVWYHGLTSSGAGALGQYVGWGRFIDSADEEVDLARYSVLVEHKLTE
jgi:hypothetical protein